MLSPLPRRSHWRYRVAHSSSGISLPRYGSRVGPRIVLFEACSAFTRVTACTLALSPYFVTRLTEGFSHFVTSMTAPVLPAGAVAGWGLHPLEKRRLITAHAKSGRTYPDTIISPHVPTRSPDPPAAAATAAP